MNVDNMNHNFEELKKAPINEVLAAATAALIQISYNLGELLVVNSGRSTYREIPDEPKPVEAAAVAPKETKAPTDFPPDDEPPFDVETTPVEAPSRDVKIEHTLDTIRAIMRKLTSKGVPELGKAIIKGRGYSKISDIKPEDLEIIYAELMDVLEEEA